jgi:hypothetical protein
MITAVLKCGRISVVGVYVGFVKHLDIGECHSETVSLGNFGYCIADGAVLCVALVKHLCVAPFT